MNAATLAAPASSRYLISRSNSSTLRKSFLPALSCNFSGIEASPFPKMSARFPHRYEYMTPADAQPDSRPRLQFVTIVAGLANPLLTIFC